MFPRSVLSRRSFLQASLAASCGAAAWGGEETPHGEDRRPIETFVPHRQLTRAPGHHWFGYYDKEEFSPDDSLVLSNQVDFEGRSPTADDTIRVGFVDLADGDTWHELGTSQAWGWQQGCMLQWLPGTGRSIIWNDRDDSGGRSRFVSRLRTLDGDSSETSNERTLDRPIYAVSPDSRFAVTTDFERIQNMRPGYGYAGVSDANAAVKAPTDSGIWRVDLDTGESRLLVSYADMAALPHEGQSLAEKWHYFNHLLVDPVGERMIFLHRWRDRPARIDGEEVPNAGRFTTRLITCRCDDGGDRYVLDPSGATSHFIWRDPETITAWSRYKGQAGFFQYRDRTREVLPVGAHVMRQNGHNTYVPNTGGEWILNDTYPDRTTRLQTVYLYHVPSNRRVDLGHFHSPPRYTGEVRVDTHPRNSRDGRQVVIDSSATGRRQLHWLDIREIIESA